MKVLLENLLRREDGETVTMMILSRLKNGCRAANLIVRLPIVRRIDAGFHRVPVVVDLAAMRNAMENIGGNPKD